VTPPDPLKKGWGGEGKGITEREGMKVKGRGEGER
jgi:hypothetical protein